MTKHFSRRQFLAGAGVATGSAVAAAVAIQHPWTGAHRAATAPRAAAAPGTLVLVTLYGGNDGLNTVIPYTDSRYTSGRPTLGYTPDQVIPLADGLGLHPNLKGMKSLWDSKQLAVVLGVGYPDPILSHFRSMDIWQSASPDTPVSTGWIGRWLDATGTDPMRALSIGPTVPLALTGAKEGATAVATGGIKIPGGPRVASSLTSLWAPGSDRQGLAARVAGAGADLLSVQHTLSDLLGGATTPGVPASTPPTPAGTGPAAATTAANNGLAEQLQLVARLIKAGASTKVYQVSLGGFDNHAAEKDTHARLLAELDVAVTGFFTSLHGDQHGQAVTLLTYSEFGRRPSQNGSEGTDHGTAGPLFVAGPSVRGGQFYGNQPSLSDLDTNRNLKFTTDFRSVYASVLGPVIGVDPKVALGASFPALGFV